MKTPFNTALNKVQNTQDRRLHILWNVAIIIY